MVVLTEEHGIAFVLSGGLSERQLALGTKYQPAKQALSFGSI